LRPGSGRLIATLCDTDEAKAVDFVTEIPVGNVNVTDDEAAAYAEAQQH
jgi:hypothetical protein